MGLRRSLLVAASGGALLLVASSAAAAPQTYTVVIEKMKFSPIPALHKGDTIIWANRDFLRHTATATNHAFDVDLPAGATKKMVLTKTGSFPFFCRYHPGMRGTLVIK